METLGLSSDPKPSDGFFKRLFWPTVQNLEDVDVLARQSFWVCILVGLLSAVVAAFTGHAIAGFFVVLIYILGGIGVREQSVPAAILIFLFYLLDGISSFVFSEAGHTGNPLMKLIILALLFANIRAAILSEKWPSEAPLERPTTTWSDKIANSMPRALWPKLRWVFFVLTPIFMLLVMIGIAAALAGVKR